MNALANHHAINRKTVTKQMAQAGLDREPKRPHSTVLSLGEEATIVTFRRHTLLALYDCLYALQSSILHLTCALLHRGFNATATAACGIFLQR